MRFPLIRLHRCHRMKRQRPPPMSLRRAPVQEDAPAAQFQHRELGGGEHFPIRGRSMGWIASRLAPTRRYWWSKVKRRPMRLNSISPATLR
jgi:hypothetical protein